MLPQSESKAIGRVAYAAAPGGAIVTLGRVSHGEDDLKTPFREAVPAIDHVAPWMAGALEPSERQVRESARANVKMKAAKAVKTMARNMRS